MNEYGDEYFDRYEDDDRRPRRRRQPARDPFDWQSVVTGVAILCALILGLDYTDGKIDIVQAFSEPSDMEVTVDGNAVVSDDGPPEAQMVDYQVESADTGSSGGSSAPVVVKPKDEPIAVDERGTKPSTATGSRAPTNWSATDRHNQTGSLSTRPDSDATPEANLPNPGDGSTGDKQDNTGKSKP